MKALLSILSLICLCTSSLAYAQEAQPQERKYLEKDYQNTWCSQHNGKTEVRLFDQTRIDCLTDSHAIEFDFASKWGESIGQSLYYSTVVHKKPGIVLILDKETKDDRYLQRVKTVADKYKITVWTMSAEDLTKPQPKKK